MAMVNLSAPARARVELLAEHTRRARAGGGSFAVTFTAAASMHARNAIDDDLLSIESIKMFRALDLAKSAEAFDEWCDLAGIADASSTLHLTRRES